MKEDVLIILNEREPLKQQMATQLSKELDRRNISHDRLELSTHLVEIIRERSPKILIVDYLLGNIGTALDILSELNLKSNKDLHAVMWTDEPSVNVAVSAMKLGCYDFIELSSQHSLEKVLEVIEQCLRISSTARVRKPTKRRSHASETPVAQDSQFQRCLQEAIAIANRNNRITLIYGEQGSGRNTLARFIHESRKFAGELHEIDFSLWAGNLTEIVGDVSSQNNVGLLTNAATVFVDHLEFDNTEFVDHIAQQLMKSPSPVDGLTSPMLIVGTTDKEDINTWTRLANAEVISIPTLLERREDLLPLIQRFIHQAGELVKVQKFQLSAELIEQIGQLSWPGNVRQLRASVIDVLTCPSDSSSSSGKRSEQAGEVTNEADLIDKIIVAKERWERHYLVKPFIPNIVAARSALDNCLGNYRVAAARLGTGVKQLYQLLEGIHNNGNSSQVETLE